MKKIIIFFAFFYFLLILLAKADEKDSITVVKKNRNSFETSITSVGEKFYPRAILEDQQNFTPNSTMGLWALIEYSGLPYSPQSWKDKGYNPNDIYDLDVKMGITADFPFDSPLVLQFIMGVGYSCNKKDVGPLMGVNFETRKLYFQAIMVNAWETAYRSKELSPEEIDYWKSQGCFGDPSYIRGFDPNSWYKVKMMYSISDNVDLGIISERFYGTCVASEYKLNKLLKFKFMFGKDFEFSKNVFCFGLLFNMK